VHLGYADVAAAGEHALHALPVGALLHKVELQRYRLLKLREQPDVYTQTQLQCTSGISREGATA
jgi:hypothetical protein